MGRKTIENQLEHKLHEKIAFGESRHSAKLEMRQELGTEYRFGMSDDKIHSIETFDTYKKVAREYSRWLVEEKGLNKYTDVEKTREYAQEYLKNRIDKGCSLWTVKMERSALGKIYGKRIEIELPKREQELVTRSREEHEHDKHFSVSRNSDLILVASACGTRREDLGKITLSSFKEKDGHLYVAINGSKGGRDRLSPILREKENEVRELLERKRAEGKMEHEKLFDKVHSKMDVHSYRREYAQNLYKDIANDKAYRDSVLKHYPKRIEIKTYTNRKGEKVTKEIQSKYFIPKGSKEKFERNDLYVVSQALGHNRIDVSYNSYIK